MQPVAVGIIMNDGHVLACQRKKTARYPLKWEFPGGKIEANESPLEALRRELREELGIEISGGAEFHTQEWMYPDNPQGALSDGSFRVYYFLITSYAGNLENFAFEQFRWVRPPELLTMDILDGNREAVNLLVKNPRPDRGQNL